MDKITVIEQTTAERKQETVDLYNHCLPYLKQGLTLRKAVQKVQNLSHTNFKGYAWYKELLDYARDRGYEGY